VAEARNGWFRIKGVQNGPRSVQEQLLGLEGIEQICAGKTVVDFGCAEACIAARMIECGANRVDALDCNAELLGAAMELYAEHVRSGALVLHHANLRDFLGERPADILTRYDVVLLLSIVHKMRNPLTFLRQAMAIAGDWVAVRLPKCGVNVTKDGAQRFDVMPVLRAEFDLVEEPATCRGEWLGIYRRR
jgi:2-polyprenyl-3-methyl-5-hydroxy-6-metoxy-1,4-benzoquinol methylase